MSVAHLETFDPVHFALVMATGILSIASDQVGHVVAARVLFGCNIVFYVVLWAISLWRLAAFPRAVAADFADNARGPGFLTVVPATALVGSQFDLFTPWRGVAVVLWFLAVALWTALLYALVFAAVVRGPRPPAEAAVRGGWLLLTVSTEALAVLGSSVIDALPHAEIVALFCAGFYMLGAVFYLLIITLIVQRWIFVGMTPEEFAPTYWMNSGAAAITTFAGARLDATAGAGALAHSFSVFLPAFTLLFWMIATWWLPMLALTEVWRHALRRVKLRYAPAWWSLVFPIGMYAAATHAYAAAAGLPFLRAVPHIFVDLGYAAWLIVGAGLVRTLVRTQAR